VPNPQKATNQGRRGTVIVVGSSSDDVATDRQNKPVALARELK
jgi:hypothetical protein